MTSISKEQAFLDICGNQISGSSNGDKWILIQLVSWIWDNKELWGKGIRKRGVLWKKIKFKAVRKSEYSVKQLRVLEIDFVVVNDFWRILLKNGKSWGSFHHWAAWSCRWWRCIMRKLTWILSWNLIPDLSLCLWIKRSPRSREQWSYSWITNSGLKITTAHNV